MTTRSSVQLKLRLFVAFICTLGLASVAVGFIPWRHTDVVQFVCYLILSAVVAGWKVALPGYDATLSVGFILSIVSICNLSISETLALGVAAAATQYCWRAKRFSAVQVSFNVSQIVIALTAAYWSYRYLTATLLHGRGLIALLVASAVYFILNSVPVSIVISLAEGIPFRTKWRECVWTFPYYLVGAAIAALIQLLNRYAGWEIALLVMPAVYIIYRSYALYIGRLEDTKSHLEQIATVHMRTVEALALAIDAKDKTTGDHVNRVRVYALELAKDLNATPSEMDALAAAAVLHDIGKLAVPEHIISKPGKLTPEEFDKMKVHPIVGAEILEQVEFPYPVVPIVRSHHEKWDGSGYPDGLCGDAIPLGARILSAVDCLDALASDRQYRRALPLDEAMGRVELESGKTFDPRVVAALKARYKELEKLAKSKETASPKLSVDVKVTRGGAPAAGYAEAVQADNTGAAKTSVDACRWVELSSSPQEAFSSMAMRLRYEVAFDAIALFSVHGDDIVPRFAFGHECATLTNFRGKSGTGLLGWVVTTRQPIVNGNPNVDFHQAKGLSAALAVPILRAGNAVSILAVYHRAAGAFSTAQSDTLSRFAAEFAAVLNDSLLEAPLALSAAAGVTMGGVSQNARV